MLPLSSKSRKPRFDIELRLLELTNLPQLAGTCYIKWSIKDSVSMPLSKPLSSSSGSFSRLKSSDSHGLFSKSAKGSTNRKSIENHKVKFDTAEQIPGVKLDIKRVKDSLIQLDNKYLVLTVYCEAENSMPSATQEIVHNMDKKSVLGTINIGIVDYINRNFDKKSGKFHSVPNEYFIDKYLLQDSKINSILSVSIKVLLSRGDSSDLLNPLFFKNGVYEAPTAVDSSKSHTRQKSSSSGASHAASKDQDSDQHDSYFSGQSRDDTMGPQFENTVNIGEDSNINNIELITELYYNTFKVPWDPRPNEYNPSQCVEDIFNGGNGWKRAVDGTNLIDLNYKTDQGLGDVSHRERQATVTSSGRNPESVKLPSEMMSVPKIFLTNHTDSPQVGFDNTFSPDMDFIEPLTTVKRKRRASIIREKSNLGGGD